MLSGLLVSYCDPVLAVLTITPKELKLGVHDMQTLTLCNNFYGRLK